ncbi:MAG: plasmid pRiA4b ORF-3 family protein [Spirulina sp.]
MSVDPEISPLLYHLRIDLLDSDPPIWRSLWVRANTPLVDLPRLLAAAMGWSGQAETQLKPQTATDLGSQPETADPPLSAILRRQGDSLRYTYAPNLGWLHRVTLAAIEPAPDEGFVPHCIAGERHCPPEFCAGVWGYEDLLDRLNDPEDPDYQDLWEQVGYDFDPEKFDLEAANQRLWATLDVPENA